VVSYLPKKSLLDQVRGAEEEETILTFLDGGPISDVVKLDTKTFKFNLGKDQWTVETATQAECEKWVQIMKIY